MRRLLFFLVMLFGIIVTTYLVLCGDGGVDAGTEKLKTLFDKVGDGSLFTDGFNIATAPLYGQLILLLINAILLITLVLMVLFNLGTFGRVRQFYTVSIWFLLGALAYSAGIGYFVSETANAAGTSVMESLNTVAWQDYVPMGAAVIILILAISFRKAEQ